MLCRVSPHSSHKTENKDKTMLITVVSAMTKLWGTRTKTEPRTVTLTNTSCKSKATRKSTLLEEQRDSLSSLWIPTRINWRILCKRDKFWNSSQNQVPIKSTHWRKTPLSFLKKAASSLLLRASIKIIGTVLAWLRKKEIKTMTWVPLSDKIFFGTQVLLSIEMK